MEAKQQETWITYEQATEWIRQHSRKGAMTHHAVVQMLQKSDCERRYGTVRRKDKNGREARGMAAFMRLADVQRLDSQRLTHEELIAQARLAAEKGRAARNANKAATQPRLISQTEIAANSADLAALTNRVTELEERLPRMGKRLLSELHSYMNAELESLRQQTAALEKRLERLTQALGGE